jgi:hypothetical protein
MCYLSELKESASCYLVPRAEMISYSDMLELLERRVVRIVLSDELRSTTVNVSNCAVFSLFGNASLLHIYMFMRDLPRGLPFLQLLSSRIRQILEREDIQRLKLQYPEMMLWIFISMYILETQFLIEQSLTTNILSGGHGGNWHSKSRLVRETTRRSLPVVGNIGRESDCFHAV